MDSWRSNLEREIAELNSEIETVVQHLKNLRDRRNKKQKELYDGRTGEVRSGDSLIVLTSDLRKHVKNWCELYDRQHGIGGQSMLAEKAKVSSRLIRAILNPYSSYGGTQEKRFVTLQTADRLLQAMNLTYLISDLDVFPNTREGRKIPEPPFQHYAEE